MTDNPAGKLAGKVAVVTGGARGIGEWTVRALLQEGASVVIADVDRAVGDKLAGELSERCRFKELDVGDPESWRTFLADVEAESGHIDLLHLNAGVTTRPPGAEMNNDPLPWITEKAYRRVMRVNVDGVLFGLLEGIPYLERGDGGSVVVTSSTGGLNPVVVDPVYSCSKHAVVGLALSFAPSLIERKISINVVCPPAVDTPLVAPDRRGLARVHPSYIADLVVDLFGSGRTGEVWTGRVDGSPPYQVTTPA
ncbi:SDR family NAD(P)-dependent oxidoreductase [Actinophytocola sp.]|uniref:SDR family NAD(P)-dependent oxidoreductase n=1 Tax=Actinophytocola sp. TaxID=1872138 RepID=UPI003D6C37FD